MSNLKLGNKSAANDIFNAMISEADKQFEQKVESDFFTKFGASEAENVRLSNAYLLKGLAYKGLSENKLASENLKKAVELSYSNLWAKVELDNL